MSIRGQKFRFPFKVDWGANLAVYRIDVRLESQKSTAVAGRSQYKVAA